MQLDLFSHQNRQGPATVYYFPMGRRAGLVRETAGELMSRTYAAGKRYWASHVQVIRRELKDSGRSRSEIDKDLKQYAEAVQHEVDRHRSTYLTPEGAA